MQQFARKPLVVEATTVEWENLADLEAMLAVKEGTPESDTPVVAYVNRPESGPASITLHDDKINGPEFDTTKEIGVLLPQTDGNFLLINRGDWLCKGPVGIFPLRPDDFINEFEVLPA